MALPGRLKAAVAAAREAGAYLRDSRGRAAAVRRFERDVKLEQDLESERLILSRLGAAFAGDGFLAEESGRAASSTGFTWIVDPLDGTVNFSRDIPHCCVSIACRSGKGTVVGVVYDFIRDELFSAERGSGAFLNGTPIRVGAARLLSEAVMAFGLMKGPEEIAAGLDALARLAPRVKKIRMMGAAALDLCYVAAGRADLFFEYGLHEWDVAAGALVLEEAGGVLHEDMERGLRRFVADNGMMESAW